MKFQTPPLKKKKKKKKKKQTKIKNQNKIQKLE